MRAKLEGGVWEIDHPKYGFVVIETLTIESLKMDSWGRVERVTQPCLHVNGANTGIQYDFGDIKKHIMGSHYHCKLLSEIHKELFPEKYI